MSKGFMIAHPLIETTNLTRLFGDKIVVNNLSLSIFPGEIFGLLGPNGAGKTTTVRMLVGLLQPSEGSVNITSRDIGVDAEECKKVVGYLPEEPALYEYLTAQEFLEFMGKMKKVPDELIKERTTEYAQLFDLSGRLRDYIGAFSRGMKQKVAIIAALINDPLVLLLDEPFMGLDPKSQRDFKDIFHQRTKDGAAVLLSTHILDVAERNCDRVGILNGGKLLATGTLEELRQMSQSPYGATLEDVFLKLTQEAEKGP
jgi:ABC-2 type transport system ATP-binding protein